MTRSGVVRQRLSASGVRLSTMSTSPALDQLPPGLVLRDDAEDDPVEVDALPAAPVVVVALQDELLLRLEIDDAVGAGAQPLLVQRTQAWPWSPSSSFCMASIDVDDQRAVLAGQVLRQQRLRLAAVEDHASSRRAR